MTTDPNHIAARLAAATPGPWDYVTQGLVCEAWQTSEDAVGNPVAQSFRNEEDGVFIAAAPTDIAYLLAQRDAVLGLHQPFEWSFGFGPVKSCKECARLGANETDAAYPCATVLAMGGGQ